MAEYFKYFPQAIFDSTRIIDITKRVDLSKSILGSPYAFLPYVIEDGMRPQDLALFYYEDVKYTWLVYLSASIIDPYYDWPLSQRDLDSYIIKEYADAANTVGSAVIDWARNTQIEDNIIHYKSKTDDTIITKDTYDLSSAIITSEWDAVRVYDYEVQKNEDKRTINLLDYRFAKQAEKELKVLLKNG
jgi:hypothetical protein